MRGDDPEQLRTVKDWPVMMPCLPFGPKWLLNEALKEVYTAPLCTLRTHHCTFPSFRICTLGSFLSLYQTPS